jgi:hypothetical protein
MHAFTQVRQMGNLAEDLPFYTDLPMPPPMPLSNAGFSVRNVRSLTACAICASSAACNVQHCTARAGVCR